MFRYFIKSTFRNLIKNKVYSVINLVGLSIGIAAFLLLFLWIRDELSYNKFHKNYEDIYRLYSEYNERDNTWETPLTPDLAAPILVEQYPSIKNSVRLNNKPSSVKIGDQLFNEINLYYTDPSFFEIFTVNTIAGNPESALNDPNSIVLTQSTANKYFGRENPINKTVLLNGEYEFKIAAVIEDFPKSSDIVFELLFPYKFLENNNLMWTYWSFGQIETYILAEKGKTKDQINSEIKDFVIDKGSHLGFIFKVQPFDKLHLFDLKGEKEGMKSVQIFALIAMSILIIACFNFINLTTAQYTKRVKEVSLKQILGSSKLRLVKHMFFETGFFVLIAGILALILIELFRLPFNNISGKELAINYSSISQLAYILLIFLITSVFSAFYPAYFITKFKSLSILTGELTKGLRGRKMRKTIVIAQFTISLILIVSTILVFKQFSFIKNKELGYNTNDIIYIPFKGSAHKSYNLIKDQLNNSPFIKNVSVVSELPSFVGIGTSNIDYEGKDPSDDKGFKILSADHDLLKTIDLKLIDGRDFSLEFSTDSTNYILNQKAIEYMGLKNPIGSRFSMFGIEGKIIGVVQDFHFLPLNQEIEPIFLAIIPNYYSNFMIKVDANNMDKALHHIEEVWKTFLPDFAFEYNFWEDHRTNLYYQEKRLINVFTYFTILTILIAAIGLVGLSMYTTQVKTKEIGIRKVLGASTYSIIKMFVKDYGKWILISIIIACPVAYYLMDRWLQNYAYRINLTVWDFIISIGLIFTIGFTAIMIQSYMAARKNPIESLRYE